jgi:hypothetical protein
LFCLSPFDEDSTWVPQFSCNRLFCTLCSSGLVFHQYRHWSKNVYVRDLICDPSGARKERSCAQTASFFLRYESVSEVQCVAACRRVLSFRFHMVFWHKNGCSWLSLKEDFVLSARNVWTGVRAPHSLLFVGYRWMFPRIKRPGRDADPLCFRGVPRDNLSLQITLHQSLVTNFELHLHELGVVFVLYEQKQNLLDSR